MTAANKLRALKFDLNEKCMSRNSIIAILDQVIAEIEGGSKVVAPPVPLVINIEMQGGVLNLGEDVIDKYIPSIIKV